ncbi:MAG: MOSC domain-containing protein [Planctomycetes bacterium]|nr:MOSC domain-containing protein [Planctomycetota bacterium]
MTAVPERLATEPRVLALLRRPAKGQPTVDASELALDPEQGVAGDHGTSKKRQVTIVAEESWSAATGELGHPVPWQARRANVLVCGVDLESSVGRMLWLGACLVEIRGETRPCEAMDAAAAGLMAKLVPAWRGGVYATVVRGGTLRSGDAVRWDASPPAKAPLAP